MAYCLDNRISFSLYSKDANFKIENGWTDYFLPFCEEHNNKNHSRFNYRMPYSPEEFKGGSILIDFLRKSMIFKEKLKKNYYFFRSPRFDFIHMNYGISFVLMK
jgi:hypothetical protein